MKKYIFHTYGLVATLGLAGFAGNVQTIFAQPVPSSVATSSAAANALPSYIVPSSPLAEVIRLVQADVEESVILSYVSNCSSTFNLDSDKIIYLSDVGVPNEITTAMMQRDQVLQQQIASAQTAPTPPPSDANYTTATDATAPADSGPVTVNYFYTALAPYGNWVNIEGYGRCWCPTVVAYNHNWQPYCDRGHWVDTDGGWYWESDYAWGVTFHYGRWFRDAHLGWCWWPDTVWAPSWVTWRYTDDYCGWAPLPPFAIWQTGIGFVYRGNVIAAGFDFGFTPDYFIFVPTGDFCDLHLHRYRCSPAEVTRFYGRAHVVNNINFNHTTIVNNGIPPQHFGSAIHPMPLREMHVPPSFSQHPVALQGYRSNRPVMNQPGHPPENNFNRDNGGNRQVDHQPTQNHNPSPVNSYPAANQNPPPNRQWSAPAPVHNNDNNQHFENGDNHPANQPVPRANESAPPHVNNPPPNEERNNAPQRSEPVENQPSHYEPPHQENPEPQQHSAPAQSSQSSDKSNQQDKDQNGHGR